MKEDDDDDAERFHIITSTWIACKYTNTHKDTLEHINK